MQQMTSGITKDEFRWLANTLSRLHDAGWRAGRELLTPEKEKYVYNNMMRIAELIRKSGIDTKYADWIIDSIKKAIVTQDERKKIMLYDIAFHAAHKWLELNYWKVQMRLPVAESDNIGGAAYISKIPGEIVRVMRIVKGYLVGGPVRDILLGLTPHDFDIASPYTPDEVEDILHRAGIPTYEVGKRFGTVGAIVGKYKVEITTFRKETYDFVSRKPKVVFAKNIAEDLARRDFTINAMAMGPDGSIVDPFHGVEDLRRGIIRFVGNPEHRILEDPLRILRALRFAARFGFKIDESSIRAIVKLSPELRRISKERIKDELYKAAQAPRFTLYIVLNDKYGLFKFYGPTWEEIIAKMHKIRHSKRGYHYGETVWQHTIDVLSRMDNWGYPWQLKIAGLTHDVGKVETATVKKGVVHFYEHEKVGVDIAIKMLRELKASGKMMKYVAFIVRYHMKIGTAIAYYKSGKFKPMARLVGEVILSGQRQWLYDLILMHRADANTEIPDGLWVALDDIMKLKRPAFPKELLNRIPPEQRKAYLYGRIVEEAIRILKGAH